MPAARSFRLIVVPYEIGRFRSGVGRGPERLLEAGAAEALSSHGARVEVETIQLDWDFNARSGTGEDTAAFELMGLVAQGV